MLKTKILRGLSSHSMQKLILDMKILISAEIYYRIINKISFNSLISSCLKNWQMDFLKCFSSSRDMIENIHYRIFKVPWCLQKGHHGSTQAVRITGGVRRTLWERCWVGWAGQCLPAPAVHWQGRTAWNGIVGGSHGCTDHAIVGSKILASKK